jgi:hypothetical protein
MRSRNTKRWLIDGEGTILEIEDEEGGRRAVINIVDASSKRVRYRQYKEHASTFAKPPPPFSSLGFAGSRLAPVSDMFSIFQL